MPVITLKVCESYRKWLNFIDHPNICLEAVNENLLLEVQILQDYKVLRKPHPHSCRVTTQKGGNLDHMSLKLERRHHEVLE